MRGATEALLRRLLPMSGGVKRLVGDMDMAGRLCASQSACGLENRRAVAQSCGARHAVADHGEMLRIGEFAAASSICPAERRTQGCCCIPDFPGDTLAPKQRPLFIKIRKNFTGGFLPVLIAQCCDLPWSLFFHPALHKKTRAMRLEVRD
jgi:hypothetical protein